MARPRGFSMKRVCWIIHLLLQVVLDAFLKYTWYVRLAVFWSLASSDYQHTAVHRSQKIEVKRRGEFDTS